MKKITFLAIAMASMTFVNAQTSKIKILDRDFWQTKPDITSVKTELNGFKFADVKNGDDPLSLYCLVHTRRHRQGLQKTGRTEI